MTMHPDISDIAAYLDGAQPETRRTELRAHLLTCHSCAAQLEQLRQDATRINALSQTQVPDARVEVRARLKRPHSLVWLAHASMIAGSLAAVLLFALLIGARSGATIGWAPDRLFVLNQEQLIELRADDGVLRGAITAQESPVAVHYDPQQKSVYVLNRQSVVAIDPQALTVVKRWRAPQGLSMAQIALDAPGEQMYVTAPRQQVVVQIDTTLFTTTREISLTITPDALAITPDGRYLYTYSRAEATLEVVDVQSIRADVYKLPQQVQGARAWLAPSVDGRSMFLLTSATSNWLYRFEVSSGRLEQQVRLAQDQLPWGLVTLMDGSIAVPRGDGQRGGVDIYDPSTLKLTQQIDPDNDQHHLIAGRKGVIFAFTLNGILTRYRLTTATPDWRVTIPGRLVDGVFVPANWHWPFARVAKE